jgi:NTP pyrophosphatase (non-canonical NTP hydrolase)
MVLSVAMDATPKTLDDFQNDVDAWVRQVGGGYWSPHANLARIAEEVGELARLVNHQYGPKAKKPTEEAQEMGEELADIVFAVICLANSEGISLGAHLQQCIEKVWVRDRNRYLAQEERT